MIIFVKDRFHIPGHAYHELEKICNALTQHWRLKEIITGLDCLSYTTWYSWYTARIGGAPPDTSQIVPAGVTYTLSFALVSVATCTEFRQTK